MVSFADNRISGFLYLCLWLAERGEELGSLDILHANH